LVDKVGAGVYLGTIFEAPSLHLLLPERNSAMDIVSIVVSWLILSVSVFLIAQLFPTIHIKNFGTAILVAVVYSVVNLLFGWFFWLLSAPFLLVTLGLTYWLFKFLINSIMLWITDKILDDFEIESFGWTLVAALCISVVDTLLNRLLT
jgi:putative membrane protein